MKNMMKRVLAAAASVCLTASFAAAQSVPQLLDSAKAQYSAGNKQEAAKSVDKAKKMIDSELLASGKDEYIEITNWDVVKVKFAQYEGKKVKIKAYPSGFFSYDNTFYVSGPGSCTYDDTIVDALLALDKYTKYYFYGTVCKGENEFSGPSMYIERVE